MEVRGSVLKSIDQFMKDRHAGKYEQWVASLSDESQDLLKTAGAQKWYPLKSAVVEPTEKLCKLCYTDQRQGAWEAGRYSAEMGLSGIYKVFLLVSTPSFLLKRSSRVMTTFYSPTNIEVAETTDKSMILHLTQLPENNPLIELRIGGWMEKALEMCGCKGLKVHMSTHLSKGDKYTTYQINWN